MVAAITRPRKFYVWNDKKIIDLRLDSTKNYYYFLKRNTLSFGRVSTNEEHFRLVKIDAQSEHFRALPIRE